MIFLVLVATILALVGLTKEPYSFYLLLRIVFFTTCIVQLIKIRGPHKEVLAGVTIAGLILYNPVVPIRIGSKPIWELLNLATVVIFWITTLAPDVEIKN